MNEEKNSDLFLKDVLESKISLTTDLDSSCEKLILLIENSNKSSVRIKSLEILSEIIPRVDTQHFNFFQELLISDEDPYMRYVSAKILIKNYLGKSSNTLKWILNNETSLDVLSTILEMLNSKGEDTLRFMLIELFGDIIKRKEEKFRNIKWYIIDLRSVFKNKNIDQFLTKELISIFLNWKILLNLEKKYHLSEKQCDCFSRDGYLVELDLSAGLNIKSIADIEGLILSRMFEN